MRRCQRIALLLLLCSCPRRDHDEGRESRQIPTVRVALARSGHIEREVTGTATVEAQRTVDIMAEASGRVTSVPVEEGDRVRSGQRLCRVDNPRVEMALERARLELEEIERKLASTAQLNERGYVARKTHDELEFRHRRAELEVRRAQEEVRALRVTAPFAGVVARRHIVVGEMVAPQRPLFSLVDDDHLHAVLHVPEAQIAGIGIGMAVRAQPVGSDREVAGEVLRLAPVVDTRSGTTRVTLSLPAHDDLKPGILISARILVERKDGVVLLPRRAVDLDAPTPSLFRVVTRKSAVGDIDVALHVGVEIGIRGSDVVEIRRGIAPGDRVVVAGRSALQDGVTVRVLADLSDPTTAVNNDQASAVEDGGVGPKPGAQTAPEPTTKSARGS